MSRHWTGPQRIGRRTVEGDPAGRRRKARQRWSSVATVLSSPSTVRRDDAPSLASRSGSPWPVSAGWAGCTPRPTPGCCTTSRSCRWRRSWSPSPTRCPAGPRRPPRSSASPRATRDWRELAADPTRAGGQHRRAELPAPGDRRRDGAGRQAHLDREAGRADHRRRAGRRRRGGRGRRAERGRLQLPQRAGRRGRPRADRRPASSAPSRTPGSGSSATTPRTPRAR